MSGPSLPPPTATPAAPPPREYDQIVSADVKIKETGNSGEYKITFVGNISKVLLYQVWSPNSLALNNDRKVFELKLNDWANLVFSKFNSHLIAPVVSYTPTCVMEIDDGKCPIHKHKNDECRHVFVINNAKVEEVNDCRKVVFYVSSKDIDKNNKNKVIKKLKKIPTTKKGELFHARFDIDYSDMLAKIIYTNNSDNSITSIFNEQIISCYNGKTSLTEFFSSTNQNISWYTIPSSDGGYWAYLAYLPKLTNVYAPTTAILTDYILTTITSPSFATSYYFQLLYLESYYVIKLNSSKVASNVYTGSYIQLLGNNAKKYSNSIPQQFQTDFTTYVGTQLTSPVTTTISSIVPPNFIGANFPDAKFAWVRTYTNGSQPPEVTFYSFVTWVNTSTASGQIPVATVFGTPNAYVYNTGVGVNSVYNSEYNCWNLSFYVYNPNGGYTQGPPVNYSFFKETNPNVDYTCMGYYPIPPGLFET